MRRAGPSPHFRNRHEYLYNLAYYADRGGLAPESLIAAEELRNAAYSRRAPQFYPQLLSLLLYPRHYWKWVEENSSRYGVEPALVLSVTVRRAAFKTMPNRRRLLGG